MAIEAYAVVIRFSTAVPSIRARGVNVRMDGRDLTRRRFLQYAGVTAAGAAAASVAGPRAQATASSGPDASGVQVAAFYFPQWHVEPLNEFWFGRGWSEWELLTRAEARFPGHEQPKVPVWGMGDEADPAVMARKINAAADSGLDAFMFDWYWYPHGENTYAPFLNRCLEEGFLGADNVNRLKFALMWANHDWTNLFPVHRSNPANLLSVGGAALFGAAPPTSFDQLTSYVVDIYMTHPSYWRVGGGAYFSIYQIEKFLDGFGRDTAAARAALDVFRQKARAAGVGELHLNCMTVDALHYDPQSIANRNQLVDALGMDSHTTYVWIHHSGFTQFPEMPYTDMRSDAATVWQAFGDGFVKPYFPNVTMGWDSTPRCQPSDMWENLGYPFTPILSGNTPGEFEQALRMARDFVLGKPDPRIITINAWNEWTEGSYLEPAQGQGMGYLNAVKHVFGS